ncbi:DUF1302 domain-containing protein [Solimonas soli]|uniref:DUF1302 domain-containing protein n=1 Tax=Solimonas soli TaxID=413479 RepID=UPI001FDED8D3|nr:DUF1302 family protein [Solimonas soli]
MSTGKRSVWACAVVAIMAGGAARAGSFDLGGDTTVDYKMTMNYGLAVRTEKQDNRLINAPVEQFQSYLFPDIPEGQPAQVFRFERQGLSQSINSDDGNRNFDRGDLIHNRLSAYGEVHLNHGDFGAVLSGSAFYDDVYHRKNANDSPLTVNKGNPPDDYPDPHYNKFTEATKYYDGERARLLEAYVYGSWYLGDVSSINVRLGQQLVAWGESLFMSGIASAQSQADATKAFVPGTEIKDILLPTPQLSFNAAVTNDLSVLGYYKFKFRPNEIFPVGDYFSPADVVGPGARYVYGSANPLYGGPGSCQGLITNLHIGNSGQLPIGQTAENFVCNVLLAPIGRLANAPRYIYTYREEDLAPSNFGQWGLGLRYQLTSVTNVGLYHLRYHDPNPSVRLNVGYAPFGFLPGGTPVTTQIINQMVPVSYNVEYEPGIHMTAASFTTVLGGFNVAGELNYRDGAPTGVETLISGHVSPVYSRSKSGQLLLSALYATNPRLFFDDMAFVAEAQYLHMIDVDRVESSPGIIPVGDGDKLIYDRDAYGIQALLIPTKHNIMAGWDFSMPITFGYLKNNPAIAGAFGALYGDGDMRASLGFSMTYLSNTQIGLGYNWFFGDAGKTINDTTLAANPYVDHDYATLNVKYNF